MEIWTARKQIGFVVVLWAGVTLNAAAQVGPAAHTQSSAIRGKKNQLKKVSEREALNIVSSLPAVKKWRAAFKPANSKNRALVSTPHIELDHEQGGEYVIHVFELVLDSPDSDSGHTATMNWYYVNKHSGKVRADF